MNYVPEVEWHQFWRLWRIWTQDYKVSREVDLIPEDPSKHGVQLCGMRSRGTYRSEEYKSIAHETHHSPGYWETRHRPAFMRWFGRWGDVS